MAVRRRFIDYQTTLPTSGGGLSSRRILASIVSATLHVAIVVLAIRATTQLSPEARAQQPPTTERPVQLLFNSPPPTPRPQPQPVESPTQPQEPVKPPDAPLTPGEDLTPGSSARVVPDPEKDPNAAPDANREEATRPDPGSEEASSNDRGTSETAPVATSTAPPQPTAESEARRIFGRPSALLGPSEGSRSSRPWETTQQNSNGCKIPEEEEAQDSTLPRGMASVQGRIFREDNGKPLAGARLQILGTQYGTFSNDKGDYKLVFDRTLVDRCRTQAVRVTAPGYRGRDVILYLGERSSSDVTLPRW
jgi:hypothetical protein